MLLRAVLECSLIASANAESPMPNPSVKRTCLRQAAYLKR